MGGPHPSPGEFWHIQQLQRQRESAFAAEQRRWNSLTPEQQAAELRQAEEHRQRDAAERADASRRDEAEAVVHRGRFQEVLRLEDPVERLVIGCRYNAELGASHAGQHAWNLSELAPHLVPLDKQPRVISGWLAARAAGRLPFDEVIVLSGHRRTRFRYRNYDRRVELGKANAWLFRNASYDQRDVFLLENGRVVYWHEVQQVHYDTRLGIPEIVTMAVRLGVRV